MGADNVVNSNYLQQMRFNDYVFDSVKNDMEDTINLNLNVEETDTSNPLANPDIKGDFPMLESDTMVAQVRLPTPGDNPDNESATIVYPEDEGTNIA